MIKVDKTLLPPSKSSLLLFAFGDTISAPLDVIFFERIC